MIEAKDLLYERVVEVHEALFNIRNEAEKQLSKLHNIEEFIKTGGQAGDLRPGTEKPDESVGKEEEPVRVLPEGKRVVRTKSSGDRVYLLDEVKKTRQWLTNPEVLAAQGFEIGDVTEVDDTELLKYQMGPAIYRVEPT